VEFRVLVPLPLYDKVIAEIDEATDVSTQAMETTFAYHALAESDGVMRVDLWRPAC
jgi:hypothetical protein